MRTETWVSKNLSLWFEKNKRELPWRASKDPYKILLSEIMLQQTTVQAVTPFFNRFIKEHPNLSSVANTELEDLRPLWSGLGYYSRLKNFKKTCDELYQNKSSFPKSWKELILLPGVGDYTSRAVSSIAFNEKVGVVDGNVIRVLSRFYGKGWLPWKSADKKELQNTSDKIAQFGDASQLNQGLMELGATVCTPKKPLCALCPLVKKCVSFKNNLIESLPVPKPKKSKTLWHMKVNIFNKGNKYCLANTNSTPFLKDQKLFPMDLKQVKTEPKSFAFKHAITSNYIYVSVNVAKKIPKDGTLFTLNSIKKVSPSSLTTKVISYYDKNYKESSK